jgi:hypothetical protein
MKRVSWSVLVEEDSEGEGKGKEMVVAGKEMVVVEKMKGGKVAGKAVQRTGFQGDMAEVLSALTSGERSWGDIIAETEGHTPIVPIVAEVCRRANTWDDFWRQSFTRKLGELWGDVYRCDRLSDEEWNAMMLWLFENGWDVGSYSRDSVEFEPADGPRRVWVPPEEESAMLEEEAAMRRHLRRVYGVCEEKKTAPAPEQKKKKTTRVIQRFCRSAGSCTDEKCCYVHGDTIPRVDKPCGFGEDCGKGDAAKRALCLYMHPGEVWNESLVIRRPVVE